jgi:hypothetical protein
MLGLTFAVGPLYVPVTHSPLFDSSYSYLLIACIASIVRLVTLLPAFHSINFTVFKVNIAAWCGVEINTSIICSSLPCLKPTVNRYFPSLMTNSSITSTNTNASRHFRGESNGTRAESYQITTRMIDVFKLSVGIRRKEQRRRLGLGFGGEV